MTLPLLAQIDPKKIKDLDQPNSFRLCLLETVPSGACIPFPNVDTTPRRGYEPIPYFGVYSSPLYLSSQDVVIQMPSKHLLSKAPEMVQKALENCTSIEAFVLIAGRAKRFDEKSSKEQLFSGDIYNLFLHMWAFKDFAPAQSIQIGLFSPYRLSSAPSAALAFEKLTSQQVHLHPDGKTSAWSPNNVKIKVDSSKHYHSGWIVAIHKKGLLWPIKCSSQMS